MTSEARKRLEALVQFSDLGSGFNIAMKDLDIRGAGNLLGGEQSGFISEIGFDMYQKILNEAIEELQENEFKELYKDRKSDKFQTFVKECVLETDLEVRIPDDYVNNVAERLSLYQHINSVKTEEHLHAFVKQLEDRFGPIPPPVEELVRSFKLRWLAQDLGMEKLVLKQSKLIGYFVANQKSPFYESLVFSKVLNFMQKNPNEVKLSEKNDKLRIIFSDVDSLTKAFDHLERIFAVETEKLI
jgi:transcription-repair coupling factor (superfamily II helicase)